MASEEVGVSMSMSQMTAGIYNKEALEIFLALKCRFLEVRGTVKMTAALYFLEISDGIHIILIGFLKFKLLLLDLLVDYLALTKSSIFYH